MKAFSFESRQVESDGDVSVFDLRGYIDAHTVIEFEKAVHSAIEAGVRRIILDISGLSYISSAGIGAMGGLSRRIRVLNTCTYYIDLSSLLELGVNMSVHRFSFFLTYYFCDDRFPS